MFERLTQDQLKVILLDVQQKGEKEQLKDARAIISELKKQIYHSINRWEFDQYEESV